MPLRHPPTSGYISDCCASRPRGDTVNVYATKMRCHCWPLPCPSFCLCIAPHVRHTHAMWLPTFFLPIFLSRTVRPRRNFRASPVAVVPLSGWYPQSIFVLYTRCVVFVYAFAMCLCVCVMHLLCAMRCSGCVLFVCFDAGADPQVCRKFCVCFSCVLN